jgi:hypothetical protein
MRRFLSVLSGAFPVRKVIRKLPETNEISIPRTEADNHRFGGFGETGGLTRCSKGKEEG